MLDRRMARWLVLGATHKRGYVLKSTKHLFLSQQVVRPPMTNVAPMSDGGDGGVFLLCLFPAALMMGIFSTFAQ